MTKLSYSTPLIEGFQILKSKTWQNSAIFWRFDLKILPNERNHQVLTPRSVKSCPHSRVRNFQLFDFSKSESECWNSGLFFNHPARNPATWSTFLCFNTMSRKKLEKNVGNRNFRPFPCSKMRPSAPPRLLRPKPRTPRNAPLRTKSEMTNFSKSWPILAIENGLVMVQHSVDSKKCPFWSLHVRVSAGPPMHYFKISHIINLAITWPFFDIFPRNSTK